MAVVGEGWKRRLLSYRQPFALELDLILLFSGIPALSHVSFLLFLFFSLYTIFKVRQK